MNVDWYLLNCEANKKAEFYGNIDDIDGIVDRMASLKLDRDLSSVIFSVPDIGYSVDNTNKVCDSLVDLLTANSSIKSLSVESTDGTNRQAREYLLQVLSNGIAGDSLQYLWLDDDNEDISEEEAAFLASYLTRNRNLTQLHFDVYGAPALQLFSCLPASLKSLCLGIWQCRGMGKLGAALGRCSSILSLRLVLGGRAHLTEIECFFRAIGPLRSLTHLEVDLQFRASAEVIDAVGYFIVQQQGTLAHFVIEIPHGHDASGVEWEGLGLALRFVKSVSLSDIRSQDALAVLPQLQSCESLELGPYQYKEQIRPVLEVTSRLPNLRDLALRAHHSIGIEHAVLDMIKSSNSINAVHFNNGVTPAAFQGTVDSYCILNRVFGTNLVGFGPTDLWARVLSRVSDGSARATLLYRLLREKPEMIVGSA